MTRLSEKALNHLRQVVDQPDLAGTRYDLVEPLGRGGMGSVYLVRDRELDRLVALKVLVTGGETPEMLERLVREARILARLEHPGIVPIHDVGKTAGGLPFYTMKLVRGQRLDQCITEETSLLHRLRFMEHICGAVAFAHAAGIVHRDLKPANIMVGPFGEVLVMDWGVAQVLSESGAPDRGGTSGFMAPEQVRGDLVDQRADIFGLGALLQFLLTGQVIPRPLRAIVEKAMASDPGKRYASAADLSRDLDAFQAGSPVSAYTESLAERAARLVTRYRLPLGLIAAYLVMRLFLLLIPR